MKDMTRQKRAPINPVWAALAAALFVQACGTPDVPIEFPADPRVVAVYDAGVVTLDDVDAVMLARSPAERAPEGVSSREVLRTVIEDIVLERLLFDVPVEPDDLERRLASVRREELHRATVAAFLESRLPDVEAPTEAEIQEYFESHDEIRNRQGKRQVHNIFLREGGRNGNVDLMEIAAEIRHRFDQGESFASLAEAFSDSESRHQGGLVGWLGRERLPPPLADVIFELEENSISEPVETPQGIHLFLVTDVVEPNPADFEDLRPVIGQRMMRERREAVVEELVSDLPEVPGAFVAEGEDLEALLVRGEASAEVLRVADYRLDVAELRNMVSQHGADASVRPAELAESLVRQIARRERIFAAASAEAFDRRPEVEEAVERAVRAAELQYRRRVVVERLADSAPEELERWFEANRNRYMTPLRLRLSRMVIPLDPASARRTMAALEALSRSPECDSECFEREAERVGGHVNDEGWMTLAELSAIRPVAAALASRLEVGEVSPPYRTEKTLESLLLHERQVPEPQSFAAVQARARADFLAEHHAEFYGRWARQAIDECGLRISFERLGLPNSGVDTGGESS